MNTNLSIHNSETIGMIDPAVINSGLLEHLKTRPVMFVDIDSPLDQNLNRIIKRMFDIVIAATLISLLIWLLPILALLICIDSPGPVFFIQKRMKKGGRYFNCFKLRTMIRNSEADQLAACYNDHRITRLGAFLRRHHLDELPQLWNVLKGDMSLIGPRPYMTGDSLRYEKVAGRYKLRYKVKPGITGLAQSYGHFGFAATETKMNERVNFDLHYITHWSVKMDLEIIGRTLWMIVKRR